MLQARCGNEIQAVLRRSAGRTTKGEAVKIGDKGGYIYSYNPSGVPNVYESAQMQLAEFKSKIGQVFSVAGHHVRIESVESNLDEHGMPPEGEWPEFKCVGKIIDQ